MATPEYSYSPKATRNPFRYALALWRFMRADNAEDVIYEIAIVEIGFARSRFGRRLARWERTLDLLKQHPETKIAVEQRLVAAPIILEDLEKLPYGTLGQVFAEHCRNRGINPNLIDIPLEEDSDWLLNHLYQTHDIWHVASGWANDEVGEVGLAGFYCGQLGSPPFFIFLVSLILLKKVLRRDDAIDGHINAFIAGYRSGRAAQPLFGMGWSQLWDTPLMDLRQVLAIDPAEAAEFGEGILAEAA